MKIEISDEVKNALANKMPVVALESTIISHGMPYPQNFETALLVEQTVREEGATPATIAIINGVPRVGLSKDEIDYLARQGQQVHKTSRRDIPYVISQKLDGATTVAGTMIFAEKAGIKIFATGGIGGVHRGAEHTFDISADLDELAQTSVAVICAGPKSILDLGLTLEYLETKGVPVVGYCTDILPAFYTRESDFRVTFNLTSPDEISKFIEAKWKMDLKGGVVIANPIPEQYSMDKKTIDETIHKALQEMKMKKISGKESTPYLLAQISRLSEGKSLNANIQLILNNAKLAAQISCAHS